MKYDPESLESDLLKIVQENLPGKIAEISAEKSDSIVLDVPADSQYFNTTDDEVLNAKLTVMYGLTDGAPVSIGPNTAEDNRYMFLIYLDDINQKPGVVRKKLYRYIRALKEIIEDNFNYLPCVSDLKVQSISPTSATWDENENSPVYKVGGIFIQASIAG